jgi:DNA-binding NarL/FixJ family response regulator
MVTEFRSKPAQDRKKIFLVEDHPAFRQGIIRILNSESDLRVCGSAGTIEHALLAIARTKPELVLVDISLLGGSGLELIKEIRSADRTVKLLGISMHDEAMCAARVLRAGGDGYIVKQEDPDEIVHAIRDLLEGHIYVSEGVLQSTGSGRRIQRSNEKTRPLDRLTASELEILELLGAARAVARSLANCISARDQSRPLAPSSVKNCTSRTLRSCFGMLSAGCNPKVVEQACPKNEGRSFYSKLIDIRWLEDLFPNQYSCQIMELVGIRFQLQAAQQNHLGSHWIGRAQTGFDSQVGVKGG